MPMDIPDVMAGIGTQLRTITGLRVSDYPADTITPPAAIVAFPESIDYDLTAARGCDSASIPVHILVGKVSARAATAQLCEYMSGTGSSSVKAAIEADTDLSSSVDTVRVQRAEATVMTVGGTDYLAATFIVEVVG